MIMSITRNSFGDITTNEEYVSTWFSTILIGEFSCRISCWEIFLSLINVKFHKIYESGDVWYHLTRIKMDTFIEGVPILDGKIQQIQNSLISVLWKKIKKGFDFRDAG